MEKKKEEVQRGGGRQKGARDLKKKGKKWEEVGGDVRSGGTCWATLTEYDGKEC